ncbi:MAG: UbiA family prenyltransferase [Verrucomicrobiota bacterium]
MSIITGLRTLLILGRTSNLPTVWTNAAVGWFLCGGAWNLDFGWLLLGLSLLYIAGMTLNDAFDSRWDSEHAIERPIPAGLIREASVWTVGLIQLLLGGTVILILTNANVALLAGLIFCILFYNWIHKRWIGSVVIMGLCRALVYLSAGSAAINELVDFPSLLLFIAGASVVYIGGVTLAARSEHLNSPRGPNMAARLMLTLPVLFPLLGGQFLDTEPLRTSLIFTGVLGICSWISIVKTSLRAFIPLGIAHSIAGIAFYDAALLAFIDWRAAVISLGCFVLTLGAQRFIPAT